MVCWLYSASSRSTVAQSESIFTCMMLTSMGISCRGVCQCSTEMAYCRTMQTMPDNSPGILVFWCQTSWQISIPNRIAKCRWGRLNAGVVAENLWLSTRSVVSLVRSQVYHTERPPYLFAACLPWSSTSRGFVSDSWSLFKYACLCSKKL